MTIRQAWINIFQTIAAVMSVVLVFKASITFEHGDREGAIFYMLGAILVYLWSREKKEETK
jgi:hypothetical protein